MKKPEFISNIENNSVVNALSNLIKNKDTKYTNGRITTAYFTFSGLYQIFELLKQIGNVKILLGTDPISDQERLSKPIGKTEDEYLYQIKENKIKSQKFLIRKEFNGLPFTPETTDNLEVFKKFIENENIQIKRYVNNFLHAKSYIFTDEKSKNNEGIIAGSSNLTKSGLSQNLELNLGKYDENTVNEAVQWFDKLWLDAVDIDVLKIINENLSTCKPYEIFMKVLWELYKNELQEEDNMQEELPLTGFQYHGVVRALKLIRENGGAIVADEVGLGKTFIAGEIIRRYQKNRQHALLVCPAMLRDTSWDKFAKDYKLFLEVVSYEELALDQYFFHEKKRSQSTKPNLHYDVEQYQLIIVDEAHNYRNPDSPYRSEVLNKFLNGTKKDVLLLTATPVNNSLIDLYNLISYFIKNDKYFFKEGIESIKDKFDSFNNPSDLTPKGLYSIIDKTTVKRTRKFIKKFYSNDYIKTSDGKIHEIIFPEPKAITVRYNPNDIFIRVMHLIKIYFDFDNKKQIKFAIYFTEFYKKEQDNSIISKYAGVKRLILFCLLKRFESSSYSFNMTINKIIKKHERFLKLLEKGIVLTSNKDYDEYAFHDDEEFEKILEDDLEERNNISLYYVKQLKKDVERDLGIFTQLKDELEKITFTDDTKLHVLKEEIVNINEKAKKDSNTNKEYKDNHKILIYSEFSDTVSWIHKYLMKEIESDERLSDYKGTIETISGSGSGKLDKSIVAQNFSPDTAGGSSNKEIDLLITTDVLAEGVNLQQARNIINYDVPWNPMRLVQRHGRIDRIGSKHKEVYLRTIFPTQVLDVLLNIQEKILRKIEFAAKSIGVVSPVERGLSQEHNYSENREEIEKLLNEDNSIYEDGGTASSTQSGEQYRQMLRKYSDINKNKLENMPWKIGSAMKGKEQGMFFAARIGHNMFLRFINTDKKWNPKTIKENTVSKNKIKKEVGDCLSLIECFEDTKSIHNKTIQDKAYILWKIIQEDLYEDWMYKTNPLNLQPKLRNLNVEVSSFIREHLPVDVSKRDVEKAIDIVETPWRRSEENKLRIKFKKEDYDDEFDKSKKLVEYILNSGLEPQPIPEAYQNIEIDDVKLLVWMGIVK